MTSAPTLAASGTSKFLGLTCQRVQAATFMMVTTAMAKVSIPLCFRTPNHLYLVLTGVNLDILVPGGRGGSDVDLNTLEFSNLASSYLCYY